MKKLLTLIFPIVDVILAPFLIPAALIMKAVRRAGVHRLPIARRILLAVGVFPIRNHYYEPLFDGRTLKRSDKRALPGIDWNETEQLAALETFSFTDELNDIPDAPRGELEFHFNNGSFEPGDAEYLYQLIRARRPRRILEIGSGNSTLIARRAVAKNLETNPGYTCKHICVEPYEMPWLEKAGVSVVRRRVEDVDPQIFTDLESGDLLFIDSSHVIRPQGDVLLEYLEILPSLKSGVIVHIHDIFTPRDYPYGWIVNQVRFWNEQYLLEAFLTSNRDWKILAALNYLHHDHHAKLKAKAPYLRAKHQPGSFYIEKVR